MLLFDCHQRWTEAFCSHVFKYLWPSKDLKQPIKNLLSRQRPDLCNSASYHVFDAQAAAALVISVESYAFRLSCNWRMVQFSRSEFSLPLVVWFEGNQQEALDLNVRTTSMPPQTWCKWEEIKGTVGHPNRCWYCRNWCWCATKLPSKIWVLSTQMFQFETKQTVSRWTTLPAVPCWYHAWPLNT